MIYLLIFVASIFQNCNENIRSSVNRSDINTGRTIFITVNDELVLYNSENKYWVFFKPVLKEYNNLVDWENHLEKIEYKTTLITNQKTNKVELSKLHPGTYYIGVLSQPDSIQIASSDPINLANNNIVQIVVRENDTFLGFVTELLGLPFILPPKKLSKYGHQTDLRIGTDCAELAIYGRRRMGYDIPYCGPRGILNYLNLTDTLINGVIIHFGYQVSILYEDRGQIGKLDGDDLIIHAFQDKVKIELLGKSEFKDKKFKLYNWRE